MPSLDGAQAWLDRAEEHLGDLKSLCDSVGEIELDAMIASLRVNDLPEGTAGTFAFTKPTASVPHRAGVLTGEAIQALRRSLDYLVFELAWLDSGVSQDDTQFPIDNSEARFEGRRQKKSRGDHSCYLIGVNDEHVTALKELQPCKGTDWTKTLAAISNPDKHRRLTVTRHTASSVMQGWVTVIDGKDGKVIRTSPTSFEFIWKILDPTLPNGMYMKMYVATFLAFEDGVEVVGLLNNLKSEVAHVLEDFAPCFGGQCHH
jgi:hypothetical protein